MITKKEKPKKKEIKKYNENKEYLFLKNKIENFKDDIFLPDYNSSVNKVLKNNNTWFNTSLYKDDNILKIPDLNEKFLINKKEKKLITSLNFYLLIII
jgi:hypothetical protein